jgi:hypothetical protein
VTNIFLLIMATHFGECHSVFGECHQPQLATIKDQHQHQHHHHSLHRAGLILYDQRIQIEADPSQKSIQLIAI